jgi:hypothetical protein
MNSHEIAIITSYMILVLYNTVYLLLNDISSEVYIRLFIKTIQKRGMVHNVLDP